MVPKIISRFYFSSIERCCLRSLCKNESSWLFDVNVIELKKILIKGCIYCENNTIVILLFNSLMKIMKYCFCFRLFIIIDMKHFFINSNCTSSQSFLKQLFGNIVQSSIVRISLWTKQIRQAVHLVFMFRNDDAIEAFFFTQYIIIIH